MKKTILVVDDFASLRAFVCEALQGKGYQTVCAGTANQAFQILLEKGDTIDLVLTDYRMPDCTGLDLLCKIKATQDVAKVPVVFLTSETNPETMRRAEAAGLFAWVNKPYRAEVLVSNIELAIGRHSKA